MSHVLRADIRDRNGARACSVSVMVQRRRRIESLTSRGMLFR